MKILFIGSRLLDDVSWYTKELGIETIVTESNNNADNLELADKKYIVPRGMEEPYNIAVKEDVDAVIPLIGIDPPLAEVGLLKEKLEEENNIPVIASNHKAASLASNKYETKDLLSKNNINTPYYEQLKQSPNIDELESKLPLVFKTPGGQGGSGVKIALKREDIDEFISTKNNIFTEEYIEGFEVSVELLRWSKQSVPLCPVYKGETTLQGTHPLAKIKQAPLHIDGINNQQHNKFIQELAIKIANLMDVEATVDMDILHDTTTGKDNIIEINTRPSGTRYMTAATTNIYPLCQLVDMARGIWNKKEVTNNIQNYCSAELPVGDFPSDKKIPDIKRYDSENSYIVHGPKHYQRVTLRAENREKLNKLAYEVVPEYSKNISLNFN